MWNRCSTSGFNEVGTNWSMASEEYTVEDGLLFCLDDIFLNCTTGDGSGGHHLVGAGVFPLSAIQRISIFLLTPVWALVLALAVERMVSVVNNLFCLRHYRLYSWLPANDWYEVGGLWIISMCWNSYLLELGSHSEGLPPEKCCGVHILQILFWGHLVCLSLCCLAAYFRQRSELKPKFPFQARKVGAVRHISGRPTRTLPCRRTVVAVFLLINIANAEVVRVGHEKAHYDRSNAVKHRHTSEQSPDCNVSSTSCARHVPTGNSWCHDDVREGLADIQFCGNTLTNLDIANEFTDVMPWYLFAPDGYHTVCRAVHTSFDPDFEQSKDTSDVIAITGDQAKQVNSRRAYKDSKQTRPNPDRRNAETDEQQLMQLSPPRGLSIDLVNSYVMQVMPVPGPVYVRVWLHSADQIGSVAFAMRPVYLDHSLPGGMIVRSVWNNVLGRRTCFAYPVRPPPYDIHGRQPHVILTNNAGENLVPTLIDYFSDHRNFRGTFVFSTRVFLTVHTIFAQVVPDNQCVWVSDCVIKVVDPNWIYTYTWGENVPVHEGIYLQLIEISPSEQVDSQTSTCATELNTAESSSSVGLEEESDTMTLMHLFHEQELAVPESLPVLLPPEHEVLEVSLHEDSDVIRSYIQANFQVADLSVVSIYTWVVTMSRPLESVARVCILQPTKSFTRSFLRDWEDRHEGRVLSVAIARPTLPPLTLRVQPIDLVAIPSLTLDTGMRAYLIDLIGNFMPRRVAIACERRITFNHLASKLGMAEICAVPTTRCFLVYKDEAMTRIWENEEIVSEPHGTTFQLVAETANKCGDETSMIQSRSKPLLVARCSSCTCGDNTATPIPIGNEDVSVFMQYTLQVEGHYDVEGSVQATYATTEDATEITTSSDAQEQRSASTTLCTLSSRPMQDVSSLDEPEYHDWAYNGRFDWVLTWAQVRAHIASYTDTLTQTLQPLSIPVHVIQLLAGDTTETMVHCPLWMLVEDRPFGDLVDLLQDNTFDFNMARTRAFPVVGEVMQNVPSILLVDDLLPRRSAILVQVISEDATQCFVFEPYRVERAAVIVDWLHRHVNLGPHYLTYNGRRIFRGDAFETEPGGIFGVTEYTRFELANPQTNTWEPESSLEMHTHNTWTSASSMLRQSEHFEQAHLLHHDENKEAGVEEHTLMQVERHSHPVAMACYTSRTRDEVLSYLKGWFREAGEVTLWLHDSSEEIIQNYPARCAFEHVNTFFTQCAAYWTHVARGMMAFVPVDPPPILMVLPRPHLIVVRDKLANDRPFLCQVFSQGHSNLVSVALLVLHPAVEVAALFAIVVPQHECDRRALCYAMIGQVRYMFRQAVPLVEGSFVKLFEFMEDEDNPNSTDCNSEVELWTEDSAVSWEYEDEGQPEIGDIDYPRATPSNDDERDRDPREDEDEGQPEIGDIDYPRATSSNNERDGDPSEDEDEGLPEIGDIDYPRATSSNDERDGDLREDEGGGLPEIGDIDYPRATTPNDDQRNSEPREDADEGLPEIGDIDYPRATSHDEDDEDVDIDHQELAGGLWQATLQLYSEDDLRAGNDVSYFEQDFRLYQQWQSRLNRVLSSTHVNNMEELLEEATAFYDARGEWPELVVCVLPDEWHRGTPRDAWHINVGQLIVYLREVLLADIPASQEIGISGVKPFVTPMEQFGEDALYILVDAEYSPGYRAIVVIEDHWKEGHPQMRPLRVPSMVDTWQIVEELDLAIECFELDIVCRLEYELLELPRMVQWQALPGMKLYLTIRSEPNDESCSMELDDETRFMQLENVVQSMVGQERHQERLRVDPPYYQLTMFLDSRMIQKPTGGVTKVWLLPGEGITQHDAAIMMDLRPEIPSWHDWIRESWRHEPPQPRYIVVKQRMPPISRHKIDFHIIGANMHDRTHGLRTLMTDLTFNNVLRRGAVRCPLLATVAEIVKHFTGKNMPVDSPLLEKFEMHWRSGGEVHVYKPFQIPAAPDGAYVQVVMRATTASHYLSQVVSGNCLADYHLADEIDADEETLMQVASHDMAIPARLASDSLYRSVYGVRRLYELDMRLPITLTLWSFPLPGAQADPVGDTKCLLSDDSCWTEIFQEESEQSVTFVAVQPRPPDNGLGDQEVHVLGVTFPHYRHMLLDLLLPLQTIRAAVQVTYDSTVLDIYRMVAQKRIRLKALLSTSVTLTWRAPEGSQTYPSYEVPMIPTGSYVQLRMTETTCVDNWDKLLQETHETTVGRNPLSHSGVHTAPPAGNDGPDQVGTSLLQLKSEICGRQRWRYDPLNMLPPPGNPVRWIRWSLETLDEYFRIGEQEVVIDICRAVRSDHHATRQDTSGHVQKVEISLAKEIQFNTLDMNFPTFQPLVDALFVKPAYPADLPFQFVTVRDLLSEEHWKELSTMQYTWIDGIDEIDIYTDGSFQANSNGLAAWAFVALAKKGNQSAIVGLDFGLSVTDPMEPGWYGAETSDARAGEIGAQVRAIEWYFAHALDRQVNVMFDAQAVGHGASGEQMFRQDDRSMRLLRGMSLALSSWLENTASPKPRWYHVKGHTGVFGNELADALAKHAFRNQCDFRHVARPDYMPYICGDKYAIEHFWWYFVSIGSRSDLPHMHNCTVTCPKVPVSMNVEAKIPPILFEALQSNPAADKKRSLFIVTYNVGTLGPKDGGVKIQYLREQLEAHEVTIACLQETRARSSQMITSRTHIRVTSAASQGHGGVEIWLLRTSRLNRMLFDPKKVQVHLAQPEILMLSATYCDTNLLIVCAHAPHTGKPEPEHVAFWTMLRTQIRKFQGQCSNVILGLDANAHFVSDHAPYVGSLGLENRENRAGELFLETLEECQLCLPTTFEQYYEGDTMTWTNPTNGTQSRCDYIALPLAWCSAAIRGYLLPSLDAGRQGEDHVPVALDVTIYLSAFSRRHPVMAFDRVQLQKATSTQIRAAFEHMPEVQWGVDVDIHAKIVSDWIQGQLTHHFPRTGTSQRNSYISQDTWNIRGQRISSRYKLNRNKSWLGCFTLRSAFFCLQGRPLWRNTDWVAMWKKLLHTCVLRRESARLSRLLSKKLKIDRTTAVEALAAQQPNMSAVAFQKALKGMGVQGRRKPTSIKPLPIVSNEQGEPLPTYQEVANRWRDYFCEQEDGVPINAFDLFTRRHTEVEDPVDAPAWTDIPSLQQIEYYCRQTRSGKGYFIDGVPGDLLHQAPVQMARLMYPLFVKALTQIREPIIHKGGRLVPSYKRGDPSQCQSYRSLFVSSPIGKLLHAYYRAELVKVFDDKLPMQIGGLPGMATTQAALSLSLYHKKWLRHGHGVAVLFIDVANAFYRLVREHFVRSGDTVRAMEDIFTKLNIPHEAWIDFVKQIQQVPAIDQTDATPFLKRIFAEFYKDTWFMVQNADTLVKTQRGSRPGDSFADLCFSFALSKILAGLEEQILQVYPELHTSWDGQPCPWSNDQQRVQLSLVLPIWADDIALAIHSPLPEALVEMVKVIAGLVFDRLSSAGLQPNLGQGKTEVVLDVKGKGALPVRRSLHQAGYLIQTNSRFVEQRLRAVPAYKHLGSWIRIGAKINLDLKVRFAVAHNTLTKFRQQIFSNKAMALATKMQYVQSLIISAMHHHAACWLPDTKREWNALSKGHNKLFKRIAYMHFGPAAQNWTAEKVRCELGTLDFHGFLTEARLRFCLQLVCKGIPHLWALIQEEERWRDKLVLDVEWLKHYCPETDLPTLTSDTWAEFAICLKEAPGKWKACIRRAVKRAISSRQRIAAWNRWHQDIAQEAQNVGLWLPLSRTSEDAGHFCLKCAKGFDSAAALSVHAFKLHDKKNDMRHFVLGNQCESCLKLYATNIDLVNHTKTQAQCRAFYLTRGQQVDPLPGVNSRSATQRLTDWHMPYMQAEGPRSIPVVPEEAFDVRQQERNILFRRWQQAVIQTALVPERLLEALRVATMETTLFPKQVIEAFCTWSDSWADEHESTNLAFLQAAQQYKASFRAEWFGIIVERQHDDAHNMAQFDAMAADLQVICPKIPEMPEFDVQYIAHLFSGHRREGDLQCALEELGYRTLSIDIIFDSERGNLLRGDTFRFFHKALHKGWIRGFVCGPPCETWSKARAVAVPGGQHPRVVRTGARPYGLDDLTRKEALQVMMGSDLLGVALRLMFAAILSGAIGVLEHPEDDPDDPRAASIWRLSIIRWLLRFANCAVVRVLQGYFGGYTPKPTKLMFTNVSSEVEEILFEHRTTALPRAQAIGREADGSWATAKLKAYPAGLCRALAAVFHHSLPPPGLKSHPEEFTSFVQNLMAEFNMDAKQGPDFNPETARAVN